MRESDDNTRLLVMTMTHGFVAKLISVDDLPTVPATSDPDEVAAWVDALWTVLEQRGVPESWATYCGIEATL